MRYFFNTANGGFHADPDGTIYPSSDAAREAATKYAGEILHHNPGEAWENNELTVTATDEDGLIVFTIIVLAYGSAATSDRGSNR
jgi:hypothetical protein